MDPSLVGHDIGFPAMLKFLPAGWIGLMVGGLVAANSSTILTHLNWGASYLVHDFYRRFVKREASEKHYVFASRIATLIIVLLSIVVTYYMNRITSGWELVLALGAGTGLVYILRWYWWRINAWSEIAAMSAALIVSVGLRWSGTFDSGTPIGFAQTILTTVAVTSAIWLIATFATSPESDVKLIEFYRRVRPAGPGWTGVAAMAGDGGRRIRPVGHRGVRVAEDGEVFAIGLERCEDRFEAGLRLRKRFHGQGDRAHRSPA